MLIYFEKFTYQEQSLLWEFSSDANMAKCTYQLAGNNVKVAPEIVNESLKNIKGIEIIDGSAVIVDFAAFEKQNVDHVPVFYVESSKQISRRGFPSPSFFTPVSPLQNSNSSSNLMSKLLSFESLLSGFEGSTLCYESILKNNNCNNLGNLTGLKIHSCTSTSLTVQVIKNIDFYYLRQIQIRLVRQLYEEVFVSTLSIVNPEEVPPKAIDYFRQAIISIMENAKYNAQDTGFEAAHAESNDPVPLDENYQIRAIYAKRMLAAFLFFINDTVPPIKADSKEFEELNKLKMWLPVFKEHIYKHKEKITHILNDLEQLIICTGLMQHDYNQLTTNGLFHDGNLDFSLLHTRIKALQVDVDHSTLAFALKKLNPAHKIPYESGSIPQKVYSLKTLVHDWFRNCIPEKNQTEVNETEINTHVERIMEQLVAAMGNYTQGNSHSEEAKWISHTIKNSDSELYVTREWKALLESEFKKMQQDLTITKKGSKHLAHLETGIVELVTRFVHQNLEQLMAVNQTTDAPQHTEMTL